MVHPPAPVITDHALRFGASLPPNGATRMIPAILAIYSITTLLAFSVIVPGDETRISDE